MPTRKTTKKAEPLEEVEVHGEWFPVYGIRIREWPHIKYVTGSTPEDAMMNLAGTMANEGRRQEKKFRTTFLNEPFEIE